MAKVTDYAWRPFGPEMRNAEWSYFSFDPPEKQDLAESDRFRNRSLSLKVWKTGSPKTLPQKRQDGSKVRHPSDDLVTSWTAVDLVAMAPTADAARDAKDFLGERGSIASQDLLTFQQSRKAMLLFDSGRCWMRPLWRRICHLCKRQTTHSV